MIKTNDLPASTTVPPREVDRRLAEYRRQGFEHEVQTQLFRNSRYP